METTTATCTACLGTGFDVAFDSPCYCGTPTIAHAASVYESLIIDQQDTESLLLTFLQGCKWSEFAQSLAKQWASKGSLSAKQLASATSMKAKCDAKAPKVAPIKVTNELIVFLADTAGWSEFSRSLLLQVERNGGLSDRQIAAVESMKAKVDAKHAAKALPTLEDAIAHGKATGHCAICNRELSNAVSVERGIGPYCYAKYYGG